MIHGEKGSAFAVQETAGVKPRGWSPQTLVMSPQHVSFEMIRSSSYQSHARAIRICSGYQFVPYPNNEKRIEPELRSFVESVTTDESGKTQEISVNVISRSFNFDDCLTPCSSASGHFSLLDDSESWLQQPLSGMLKMQVTVPAVQNVFSPLTHVPLFSLSPHYSRLASLGSVLAIAVPNKPLRSLPFYSASGPSSRIRPESPQIVNMRKTLAHATGMH